MTYSIINRSLRPARVVIVFDGGERWSYWARYALYLANQLWGGAGFAVVPHRGGVVDPVLLRACRAFDPDHVVTFVRPADEFAVHATNTSDGTSHPADDHEQPVHSPTGMPRETHPDDLRARDLVAAACSPYNRFVDSTPVEAVRHLKPSPYFPSASVPGAETSHVLHCPPGWGGLVGAAVASHAGVPKPPEPPASEPDVDDATLRALTTWLLHQPPPSLPFDLVFFPNGVATGVMPQDSPLAHVRTMAGLARVRSSPLGPGAPLVVLGDTADDFALARLWHLTYGCGVWLPSVLGTSRKELSDELVSGLAELADATLAWPESAIITSTSQTPEELTDFETRLRTRTEPNEQNGTQTVPAIELPWTRSNTSHLAIADQVDDVLSVPTIVDDTGTVTMVAPVPPAVLTDPSLASHRDLNWHVDYSWAPRAGVLGRGVLGHELFTAATSRALTLARSSRHGVSHLSQRFDGIFGGIPPASRVPRPALRDLSLFDFVKAKAAEHGMTVRVSDAGQRTAQLTRMLGGRDQFVALFGHTMLPLLYALRPTTTSNSNAYPDGDGVVLRAGEGVLSFAGMSALAPSKLDRSDLRERVDVALRAGVLRRGMVLRCQTCQSKQFQSIDKIGQLWTCERCDAANDLDRHVWHSSTDEPTWFYGLHPVAHQLLHSNGEAAALLADHLSWPSSVRPDPDRDVTEVEFVEGGTAQVEVDLIAYRDDVLTVAECKSSRSLAGGSKKQRQDEITKKCRAAAWLHADQLMFATTEPNWRPNVKDAIRGAVSSFPGWPATGCPKIVLVTGLGGPGTKTTDLPVRVRGASLQDESVVQETGDGGSQ